MIFWSKCIALGLQRYKKVWKTIYNKGVEYEVLRYFLWWLWYAIMLEITDIEPTEP